MSEDIHQRLERLRERRADAVDDIRVIDEKIAALLFTERKRQPNDDDRPVVDMRRELRDDSPLGRIVKFIHRVGAAEISQIAAGIGLSQTATGVSVKVLYTGGYLMKVGNEYALAFESLEFPPQRGVLGQEGAI